MNLPNKLTMLRVILIPFFVFALLNPGGIVPYSARKYGLVTDFGKFMDPLADKLLVCSAMICLIEMGRIPSWIVIIIVAREFAISGFRLIAADNGIVIAASYWGKFKTTFQMIMIILMILNIPQLQLLTNIIMWVALALTIISLCDYIMKNKQVISQTK